MRKSFIGLMVVTLLLFAGQAGAQGNGTGDPLGLIASGAVQPIWALGANITIIEIASPVGDNADPIDLEGVFFNAACVRQFSFPIPVTENGIAVFATSDFGGVNFQGLLTIARQGGGIDLIPIPLDAPIHVRGIWVNLGGDFLRPVDPIGLVASENPVQTWNVLRSAASFVSPLEGATFHTEIFLNCLSPAVFAAFPPGLGFPPPVNSAFSLNTPTVLGVIYNDDEEPLIDFRLPCGCSSMFPVLDINPVYGNPAAGSGFFYTEMVTYSTGPIPLNPPTFTGYRAVTISDAVWPGGTGEDFGRLNNGSAAAYVFDPPVFGGR